MSDHPEQSAGPMPVPGRRSRRFPARLRRLIAGLLALGMLAQLVYVFTPVGDVVSNWLVVIEEPQPADFIVCLGGRDERLIWVADLYRRGLATRVIVSNRAGAAEKMGEYLMLCGVPAGRIQIDVNSHCTADHPQAIGALPGIDIQNQRFLIVTDALHSRRAAACFRRAGYSQFQFYAGQPAGAFGESRGGWQWRQRFIEMPYVAYEYTALLKYWLWERI